MYLNMRPLIKKLKIFLIFSLFIFSNSHAENFDKWLIDFKKTALKRGVSKNTIEIALKDARFLKKVIYYDNKQPEFFEKTNVYISKRSTKAAVKRAKIKLRKHKKTFNEIEKEFGVEKELLLALWSIETNYGKYFGKMDTISSLATLSFDKRRSAFFTEELIILLKLMDKNIVSKDMLFGSWAGAIGNFQFMPSSILNHGIDYDKDGKIDLKNSIPDSIASAANYISKIGWKYNDVCFTEVEFNKRINKKYFNHSARNIKYKKDIDFWISKGVQNKSRIKHNLEKNKFALVLPDGNINSPKYLVTSNYEKILKWNRSLRFALSVCTLKNMIKNEI